MSIDLLCASFGILEVTAAYALSILDGMGMLYDPHLVSTLSQIWKFHVQERMGDQERHGDQVLEVIAACCLTYLLAHTQQMKNKIRIKSSQVCCVVMALFRGKTKRVRFK